MKAKPMRVIEGGYEPCDAKDADVVMLSVPGCFPNRIIPVTEGRWTWNRYTERPTLSPSILTTDGKAGNRCHSFVRDGMIEFLADCSHECAGKTVPLLDVE